MPALPLTLPVIVAVTVKFANVPTLVSDDAVTPAAKGAPVNVPAEAVTVTLAPRLIDVPFTGIALLARLALAIAVPLQTPV